MRRKIFNKFIAKVLTVVFALVFVFAVGLYLILNFDALKISYFSNENDVAKVYEASLSIVKDEENRVEIPNAGIAAKLSFPVDSNSVDALLDESVVHLPQTAMPGENNNVVVTGHSSSLANGAYRNIFASLYRLKNGDEVDLYYKNTKFVYEVSASKVVAANDSSVLSQDKAGLTLITCWPLGTDWARLVVTAKLVR